MSVLIHGMEMPKACVYRENGHLTTCPLYDIDGYCGALNTEASHNEGRKLPDCPLVPIQPHGRLIDADELIREHRADNFDFAIYATYLVQNAPTVLEEEGE